jgi:hypothetical protein
MANIREFSAPSDLGLRPDSRADESLANSGRRIAALYNRLAKRPPRPASACVSGAMDVGNVAQKFMEHREISQGAAEAATTLSTLDQKVERHGQEGRPERPDGGGQVPRGSGRADAGEAGRTGPITEGGQKFAEAQVERFRNHFVSKTSADMARLAGVAAGQNIETLKNQLSNAAISDPTSLKTSLAWSSIRSARWSTAARTSRASTARR